MVTLHRDMWGWVDTEYFLCTESGQRVSITPQMVVLAFWDKYRGRELSEVSDIRDLNWLLKVAREKKDVFAEYMFVMRLKELS